MFFARHDRTLRIGWKITLTWSRRISHENHRPREVRDFVQLLRRAFSRHLRSQSCVRILKRMTMMTMTVMMMMTNTSCSVREATREASPAASNAVSCETPSELVSNLVCASEVTTCSRHYLQYLIREWRSVLGRCNDKTEIFSSQTETCEVISFASTVCSAIRETVITAV